MNNIYYESRKRDSVSQAAGVSNPLPVFPVVASVVTSKTLTAGTDFSVGAGSAGDKLKINLPVKPILGGNLQEVGHSLSNTGGLVFGGALATTTAGGEQPLVVDGSGEGDISDLSNGDYMVDYANGIVYVKRGDNATTGTIAIKYLASINSAGPSSSDAILAQLSQMPVAEKNSLGYYEIQEKLNATSENAGTVVYTTALAASLVVKAAQANLYQVIVEIAASESTSLRYIQIYNASSLPADGTVTHLIAPIQVSHVTGTPTRVVLTFAPKINAVNGIVIGLSTSQYTKAIAGAVGSITAIIT